tara:strand:- start:1450 stop:1668 length:219 start_codon:yes stop_codon:yes gene_type:complete
MTVRKQYALKTIQNCKPRYHIFKERNNHVFTLQGNGEYSYTYVNPIHGAAHVATMLFAIILIPSGRQTNDEV